MIIAVLGATSDTGRCVVTRLAALDHLVIAIGRNEERLARLDPRAEWAAADLKDRAAMARALGRAQRVVSLAPARYTRHLLEALPPGCERVVLTGSIRRDTRLRDKKAEEVRSGEAEFVRSGVTGVMLHPSMIYGGSRDHNVGRVLRLIRRWPRWAPVVLPLPDGGRHTVQPVFIDDVADSITAAVLRPHACGPPISVVGPEPISYASLVRLCAKALGRRAWILPGLSARLLAALARLLPLPVEPEELLRAAEDKRYDARPLATRLGIVPRPFEVGLRLKLEQEKQERSASPELVCLLRERAPDTDSRDDVDRQAAGTDQNGGQDGDLA